MRTRHEDDLRAEAYAHGGVVSLTSLIDHCENVIAAHPERYGEDTVNAVRTLVTVLEQVVDAAAIDADNAEVPYQDVRVS